MLLVIVMVKVALVLGIVLYIKLGSCDILNCGICCDGGGIAIMYCIYILIGTIWWW